MLTIPSYIERSLVVGAPIKHTWDDEDLPTFYTESDRIQREIARTTTAGAVVLALGCLEWVGWRMSKHSDVTVLFQAIEAIWAGVVDPRYARSLRESRWAPRRSDWQGAERGPVYVAYKQLKDLQRCLDDRGPASPNASCAVRMGRTIVPKSAAKAFKSWWQFALKRLVKLHPDREEGKEDIGRPIPREALDPAIDYKPRAAKRYLSMFLKSLDPKSNPFLASPNEMKKAGLKGSPYR